MMRISSVALCRALPLGLHHEELTLGQGGPGNSPVELLLSYLVYLVGAARVVADDVEEVSGRRNFLTVGGFSRALHKPNGDPAPLARSSQSPKEETYSVPVYLQVKKLVS